LVGDGPFDGDSESPLGVGLTPVNGLAEVVVVGEGT